MMHIDLIMIERKLQREKRLLDVEVKIDALVRLLVSRGLITEAELARETAIVKSNEKYDFDVHDGERDIEVFRAMLALCTKEEAWMHGLSYTKEDA